MSTTVFLPPRRNAVLVLALLSGCFSLHAQNLLPNPGFEDGTDQPSSWRKPDGAGGEWSTAAHSGRRSIRVLSDGKNSSAWRTERMPLAPGGLYRLRYWARRDAAASGGCAVSGTGLVNRDFHFSEDWQPVSFVFAMPTHVTNDYVRLGHWEVKGALSFDDAELLPVQATHAAGLGEGESIRDGVYRFQPNYGWEGANYHRTLWRNQATFNSDRWNFGDGAEIIYRFAMPQGVQQTNGQVRVNVNYHTAGILRVEAGHDGAAWTTVAEYDGKHRSGQTNLPASLFPAPEIFLRLRAIGPGANLQVNGCDYEAGLKGKVLPAEGATHFFEVLSSRPELMVKLSPVDTHTCPGEVRLWGTLSNQSRTTLSLRISLETDGNLRTTQKASLKPGQEIPLRPSIQVPGAGNYALTLKIEDNAGQALFLARSDARVATLLDPRPGYWLAGNDATQIWWCESGWKPGNYLLGRDHPARMNKRPLTVSAARGEFEAAQVMIGAAGPQSLDSATVSPLRNTRGEAAPIKVSLHEVARVQVTRPTDSTCDRGWYPDPLPPLKTPLKLAGQGNQPIWVTFHVAREAKPGDYAGELKLTVDGKSYQAPLSVHVYDFELPRETHLRSALGMGAHDINRYHKLKTPADQQAVYDKYLQNFADHRISPYSFFDYAPMDIQFTGQGTNKQAKVDFTKFDAVAAHWLDQVRFNSFLLPLRGMGGGTFQSRSLGSLEGFKEGTPEFARLFQDYLSQVTAHLRERGWLDKAYTYWFDEPDRKDYEFVVDGMKRIRAAVPGLRRMLTKQPEPELMGHVEIWCGLTPEWTPERVQARRAAGEEVWWYICCGPKAPYVTEFIDHPGTELRLWPWQSWQYGVQGILIWATTYWTSSSALPKSLQDPWADPMSYVSGYDFGPGHVGYWGNGDGRFLYPPRRDPNNATEPCLDGPISSIRWENLRDGMEDYEYFWLLDHELDRVLHLPGNANDQLVREARALLKVPEEISKDLTHFTTDPRLLLAHRDQVARAIERLQRLR